MTGDDPSALLAELEALLGRLAIPHMIVGSFASTLHGEPRTTRDLDVVIDPSAEQLDELLAALPADRYYVDPDVARDALAQRSMFNVIDSASAWKIDLMIRKPRAFSIEELGRRVAVEMLGVMVPAATAEDTILAKLEWSHQSGSDRQLEDVRGILRVRGHSLDHSYIERWVDVLEVRGEWERAQRGE